MPRFYWYVLPKLSNTCYTEIITTIYQIFIKKNKNIRCRVRHWGNQRSLLWCPAITRLLRPAGFIHTRSENTLRLKKWHDLLIVFHLPTLAVTIVIFGSLNVNRACQFFVLRKFSLRYMNLRVPRRLVRMEIFRECFRHISTDWPIPLFYRKGCTIPMRSLYKTSCVFQKHKWTYILLIYDCLYLKYSLMVVIYTKLFKLSSFLTWTTLFSGVLVPGARESPMLSSREFPNKECRLLSDNRSRF